MPNAIDGLAASRHQAAASVPADGAASAAATGATAIAAVAKPVAVPQRSQIQSRMHALNRQL